MVLFQKQTMTVDDNSYDFLVRDRLFQECKDMNYKIHYDPEKNKLMIDMITYCSQGNQDEALRNLMTTKEFQDRFKSLCSRLNIPPGYPVPVSYFSQHWVYSFLFKFWRKCFIEVKIAVEKKEAPLRVSFNEIIMRDYEYLLNEQNFPTIEVFRNHLTIARNNLLSATDNLNIIFKEMREVE